MTITTTEHTSVVIRANLAEAEGALAEFEKIEAGLAELRSKYDGVVFAVGTPKGMREAVAARTEIREPRYKTEHARKAGKAPVIALGKNIDGRAAYITEELFAIENPIHDQIEAENKRKARVEAERVAKIKARIQEIGDGATKAIGKPAIVIWAILETMKETQLDESFAEFKAEAEQAQAQAILRLNQLHADAVKAEADRAELAKLREEKEKREREEAEARKLNVAPAQVNAAEPATQEQSGMSGLPAPGAAPSSSASEPANGIFQTLATGPLVGPGSTSASALAEFTPREKARAILSAFKVDYGRDPEFSAITRAILYYFKENP